MSERSSPFARRIAWTVEAKGILVIDTDSGERSLVEYPEAALWDFIARGLPRPRTIELLAAIAGLEKAEADSLAERTLAEWRGRDWLDRDPPAEARDRG